MDLVVANCPSQDMAKTNKVFVAPRTLAKGTAYLEISSYVFLAEEEPSMQPGKVGMNAIQRRVIRASSGDTVAAQPFTPPGTHFGAVLLNAELEPISRRGGEVDLPAPEVETHIQSRFADQVFTSGQELTFEFQGLNYLLRVSTLTVVVPGGEQQTVPRAMLSLATSCVFETRKGSGIKIVGQKSIMTSQLFKQREVSFEKLGIGGLDSQFREMFRRAFESRRLPPSVVERLGIKHRKGILLYGPPGTGKTLIARQLGMMLNGKEPKVVNGPEVLNKYVGASEENIRNLFKDAEEDYLKNGDDSELHVIIFDEIDAICKSRGSVRDGSGVHDTIVNQLLTKIDGVNALNNILVIGMTNRLELLDEALLREGRLDVHMEIGLPDENGRLQILKIHTRNMSEHGFLAGDVDLAELAHRTQNYSGAELEGLVRSATSFALDRETDMADLSKPVVEENIRVTRADFLRALDEVRPSYGAATETLEQYRPGGMLDIGPQYHATLAELQQLLESVEQQEAVPLSAALLWGDSGTGKTALASTLAIDSGFPFVKVVTTDSMVGYSDAARCSQITKVFEEAYRSPLSLIVLDDIENLLAYRSVGLRYADAVLSVLIESLKKLPPPGHHLFVIGTTSNKEMMQTLGLSKYFQLELEVPPLDSTAVQMVLAASGAPRGVDFSAAAETLYGERVPIKDLLFALHVSAQGLAPGETTVSASAFQRVWARIAKAEA
ncbi:hypothetical protein ACKKBG_A07415 [Auxenochlorella protothecoides x Auxenochlorella symbiontica]